jgi:hypothetical protein
MKRDEFERLLRRLERGLAMWRGLARMGDHWKRRGEDFALRRLMGAIERGRDNLDSSDMAGLLTLDAYAVILARRGLHQRALAANCSAAVALEQALGPRDPLTLRALLRRAQLLWRTDEGAAALQLAERVLETSRRLGNAATTRAAAAGLALILADQGRLPEARALQEEVLEGRVAELGEAHPDVLRALIDLFMTQVQLGDTAVAQNTLARVQTVRIATFQTRYHIVPDLLRIGEVMEANLTDFREQQALQVMLETRDVPSRRSGQRELFEL